MKFSEQWLRDWVNPTVSTDEIVQQLTMAGLELDGIEPAAPDLSGVIVARIDSTEPHPDADKLQVCQVNIGKNETRQIVCGANNARPGLMTALATEGAILPGGLKIKAAKLRGVESFGMLCATSELGLDEESAGIVELDDDLTIGQSLTDALDLNDSVLDIDLTPNRSDCLSIEGIARGPEHPVHGIGARAEFGRIGLAHHDSARGAQIRDDALVFLRHMILVQERPERRTQPCRDVQILHAHGQTVQRAE